MPAPGQCVNDKPSSMNAAGLLIARESAKSNRPLDPTEKILMSTLNTIRPTFLAAALALLTIPAQAVTVLYSDDFSGDGTANLNSTTPDTTIGTNTWSANANIKNNGSVAAVASADAAAGLTFTPTIGKIYTLSATLAAPTGGGTSGSWFAFGFTDVFATGTVPQATYTAWMLWRSTSDATEANRGDLNLYRLSTSEAFPGNPAAKNVTGTQTLSIVLDTTDLLWSIEWFQGATSLGTMDYVSNPTINNIFFGRNTGAGFNLDSMSLTVVPEPSAALLGGLGILALLRRRR